MRFRNLVRVFAVISAGALGAQVIAPVIPTAIGLSPVSPAAAADKSDRKDDAQAAYVREQEGQFESWGRKIDSFNKDAARKGKEVSREAQKKLDAAWVEVKRNWESLKAAGSAGWQETKDAYERSRERLERAWDEVQS